MGNINVEKLIEACDLLERRTVSTDGCMHSSSKCFYACMKAFREAEAITFRVFLNSPIMEYGEATIHRTGKLEMHTI